MAEAAGQAEAPPPAVTVVNENGASRFVLVCEHASNHIPPEYDALGLPERELGRHIAWDIGAAALGRRLSALLDAPLFLSGYSRLLIDLNRPLGAPTSIPAVSEATEIPGNRDLSTHEKERRAARYFRPFHERLASVLDARQAANKPTVLLGIHSFTPVFLGVPRPWHAGVLHERAAALGRALVERLAAEPGLTVGDNEPYKIFLEEDYAISVHGDQRGIDALLIEVRQDLLNAPEGIEDWALRLAAALADVCGTPPAR